MRLRKRPKEVMPDAGGTPDPASDCDTPAPVSAAPPEPERTDMYCTECGKNFIAQLDMGIDGNHILECPYCGHEHCRVVEKGKVTEARWSSRAQRINVDKRCVWKSDSLPMKTTTAAAFIRDAWLNREDLVLS